MSSNEISDSLKVVDISKSGIFTQENNIDSISQLNQTENHGIQGYEHEKSSTTNDNSLVTSTKEINRLLSSSATINKDDYDDEETDKSPSNKRSCLIDDNTVKVNENENQSDDIEKDDEHYNIDDRLTQRHIKKRRWGSEQDEELSEKRSNTSQTSEDDYDDDDDDDDDDDTIDNNSSSRHRERDNDRDYYRSSKQNDDDRHNSYQRIEKSDEKAQDIPEESVQFNQDDVVLDFYGSDLNLNVSTDCLSASNKSNDALCFLWAGVRGTYGFKYGKISYEIRITEIIDCPQMPDNEIEPFGLRVGWSDFSSGLYGLQLGEINNSFAYTSTGRKISRVNGESIDDVYGEPFGLNDVIACYIDFGNADDSENLIRISFMKNSEDLGQAFEISKQGFNEFYPHILSKNVKFECNFGHCENSWSKIKSDFIFAQNVPVSERIRTSETILEKNQCQAILISGLIGSGKTTWANRHIKENPQKNFYLLNIEHILSKMTTDGKPLHIKDRNDSCMLRGNVCLQKLIEIAPRRKRNYIIDHVNTTRECQSKYQRLFTGFRRIGVVIIPDDEDLKERIEKIEKNENIVIPHQWIREAKGKFYFPQTGLTLEEVIYPELSFDDAKLLYDKVRKDFEQSYSPPRNNSNVNRNRYDSRDRFNRDHDRERNNRSRSRSRSRDRDRRISRDNPRYSSSYRNDNFRGNFNRGEPNRHLDHRQDSRNMTPRGNFHDRSGQYRGRGGHYHNQSTDEWRNVPQHNQRKDFGSGTNRGNMDHNRNQYSNRGSYHDNQRSGGFRQDFNNQQRGRQFNDYENKSNSQSIGRGYLHRSNYGNQQQDRQNVRYATSMQQNPQHSFNNQQQPQRTQTFMPNKNFSSVQQTSSNLPQQITNNANVPLQNQNSMSVNSLPRTLNTSQQNSLESWLALCAAALNSQPVAVAQPTQQDANSLTQQWAQWLKTAQAAQLAQQSQAQLAVQQTDTHQQTQISDPNSLYYQAYYAQLAAAQQQAATVAAALAAGSTVRGMPPPSNNNDK